jgi:hypothetical protein
MPSRSTNVFSSRPEHDSLIVMRSGETCMGCSTVCSRQLKTLGWIASDKPTYEDSSGVGECIGDVALIEDAKRYPPFLKICEKKNDS